MYMGQLFWPFVLLWPVILFLSPHLPCPWAFFICVFLPRWIPVQRSMTFTME